MKTISLTDAQYSILEDFLNRLDNSFDVDSFDNQVYFQNDILFRCSKREYNSLKKAFKAITEPWLKSKSKNVKK